MKGGQTNLFATKKNVSRELRFGMNAQQINEKFVKPYAN